MRKHQFLYTGFFITSLLVNGCVTTHPNDAKIDACSVTKPPKDSHVMEVPHGGYSYTYPDLSKGIGNYTGCVKTWFGDDYYLLQTLWFVNGSISRAELMEPHEEKVTCEFDSNKLLIKGSYEDCKSYTNLLIEPK